MNAKALIRRTRDGERLTRDEIRYLVQGAVSGEVRDYQLTAWMMAVLLRGLSPEETVDLTWAMLESGRRLSHRSGRGRRAADKHSTGGVGDKLSFLVAPMVAACGVPVPMISGRSLGHTGGTLDKLETVPGLRTDLSGDALVRQVEETGLAIAGQNRELAPADGVLYALRDAASIVESVPLITASILSKKAAAGVEALVLDVKFGQGAFMPDLDRARALARSLVGTAGQLGLRTRAVLTRMDLVLGRTAGNALELAESARALSGAEVEDDIRDLALALAGSMLELSGPAIGPEEARAAVEDAWRSGRALDTFASMVAAQGGDPAVLEDPRRLPAADHHLVVSAPRAGFFHGLRARPVGEWITEAGGGRLRTGDPIDPRIGVEALVPGGTRLRAGDPVLRLHLAGPAIPQDLEGRAAAWIALGDAPADAGVVVERVDEDPAAAS